MFKVFNSPEGIAIFNNTQLVSRGAKNAKTYALAAHAAAPRLACGTNLGAVIVGIADLISPAVAADPAVCYLSINLVHFQIRSFHDQCFPVVYLPSNPETKIVKCL